MNPAKDAGIDAGDRLLSSEGKGGGGGFLSGKPIYTRVAVDKQKLAPASICRNEARA